MAQEKKKKRRGGFIKRNSSLVLYSCSDNLEANRQTACFKLATHSSSGVHRARGFQPFVAVWLAGAGRHPFHVQLRLKKCCPLLVTNGKCTQMTNWILPCDIFVHLWALSHNKHIMHSDMNVLWGRLSLKHVWIQAQRCINMLTNSWVFHTHSPPPHTHTLCTHSTNTETFFLIHPHTLTHTNTDKHSCTHVP